MNTSSVVVPRRFPGRLFLALGLGLPFFGLIGFGVQLWMERLITPWYLPCAATLGVIFVVVSLWQTRTIWRMLALLLVVLLAGAEWAFLVATRLPAYDGPITMGQPFPAFATTRADETPFTQRDLTGDQNTVMVFFRGRW